MIADFQIQFALMADWKHGLCGCCSPCNMMCKPFSSKLLFSSSPSSSSSSSSSFISTENPHTSSSPIVTMSSSLCHRRHQCRLLCHVLQPLRLLWHGRGHGAWNWGRAPDIVVIIIMSMFIKSDHDHQHCQRWLWSLSKVMHLVLGFIFPLAPLFLLRGQAREKSGIEVGLSFLFVFWLKDDVTAMKILMTTIEWWSIVKS